MDLIEWLSFAHSDEFDKEQVPDVSALGSFYEKEYTIFCTWAVKADVVYLVLDSTAYEMERGERNTYRLKVEGDYDRKPYHYEIHRDGKTLTYADPFAYSCTVNSEESCVIDLNAISKNKTDTKPMDSMLSAVIYEVSVRDFSSDSAYTGNYKSAFLSFTEKELCINGKSIGITYLKELGVTHIQLMPILDYDGVDEKSKQPYNWGYDPFYYNVSEGSYVVNQNDPYARINELVTAVAAVHGEGIKVNLDVVFNHVADMENFAFQKMCPTYFFRYDENMYPGNASWCGNEVRSEAVLVRSYFEEMVRRYIDIYDIDGLRFDLMGVLDTDFIKSIEKTARSRKSDFMMYGEGWNMGSILQNERKACTDNAGILRGTGFFDAKFRDSLRGSLYDHVASGGFLIGNEDKRNSAKETLSASDTYYLLPEQKINYLECHDNLTFYDFIKACGITDEDMVKKTVKLGLTVIILSKGIPFIHSGMEFMRTKNGIDDSYNKGDEINRLDWNRRIIYDDVCEYCKHLIDIRKSCPEFFESSVTVSFEDYYDVLIYRLGGISVFINPSSNDHVYVQEEDCHIILEDGEKTDRYSSSIDIKAHSATVTYRT